MFAGYNWGYLRFHDKWVNAHACIYSTIKLSTLWWNVVIRWREMAGNQETRKPGNCSHKTSVPLSSNGFSVGWCLHSQTRQTKGEKLCLLRCRTLKKKKTLIYNYIFKPFSSSTVNMTTQDASQEKKTPTKSPFYIPTRGTFMWNCVNQSENIVSVQNLLYLWDISGGHAFNTLICMKNERDTE